MDDHPGLPLSTPEHPGIPMLNCIACYLYRTLLNMALHKVSKSMGVEHLLLSKIY